jgi:hypothetical protein
MSARVAWVVFAGPSLNRSTWKPVTGHMTLRETALLWAKANLNPGHYRIDRVYTGVKAKQTWVQLELFSEGC